MWNYSYSKLVWKQDQTGLAALFTAAPARGPMSQLQHCPLERFHGSAGRNLKTWRVGETIPPSVKNLLLLEVRNDRMDSTLEWFHQSLRVCVCVWESVGWRAVYWRRRRPDAGGERTRVYFTVLCHYCPLLVTNDTLNDNDTFFICHQSLKLPLAAAAAVRLASTRWPLSAECGSRMNDLTGIAALLPISKQSAF